MSKRHKVKDTDSTRYYDWLDKAGEDFASAQLLREHEECYNNAAFHCQQAIEKALKAYILIKSDILVEGHNLTWLCKRAMKYDEVFENWLEQSSSLNKCYVETRYPADLPLDLDYSELSTYFSMAQEMYLFICAEVDRILQMGIAHPGQRE